MGVNRLQSNILKERKHTVEAKLDINRHTETRAVLDVTEFPQNHVNALLQKPTSEQNLLDKYSQDSTLVRESENRPGHGWLTYHTDKHPKVRRHFWKIEKGLITLHLSENSTLFYKQIPLSTILEVKQGKDLTEFKIVLFREKLTISADAKVLNKDPTIMKRWHDVVKKGHREAKIFKLGARSTDNAGNREEEKPKGIFLGMQFTLDLSGATFNFKKQLRELIINNGGQMSYILTSNTDFLVMSCDCLDGGADTYKYRKAVASGIPVITEEFIKNCVQRGKLVSVPDRSTGKNAEDFSKGKVGLPVTKPTKKKSGKKFHLKSVARYKIDDGDTPDFPEEFQVSKFSILECKSQSPKVVAVEAQIAKLGDSSNFYRVMVSSKVFGENIQRHVYPVITVTDLTCCYEALVKQFIAEGMKRIHGVPDTEFSCITSETLNLMLNEMKSSAGIVQPQVVMLVESIWTDSLGCMKFAGIDPENITVDQVRNAMTALLKIEEALKGDHFKAGLSADYYKCIKENDMVVIDSIEKVAKKRQVCQLLKDIVSLNENSWLKTKMDMPSFQYLALKCAIVWLDPNGKEFKTVKDLLPVQSDGINFDVQNIFRINRSSESSNFRCDIKNRKFLFHASSATNFVSIFSKGLVMPCTATSELGISRRDEGRLGAGIYFSDCFGMSTEFTSISPSQGTRRILVNEVALGEIFETKEPRPDLEEPPEGFQSVKGIGMTAKGHEYAVYDTDQQRMKYIIEFSLNDEMVTEYDRSPFSLPMPARFTHNPSDAEAQECMDPSVKEIEYGLVVDGKKDCAKLEEVHVCGKIIDLVSEVTLFQAYKSTAGTLVEAKYVFPLTDNAAVSGFEAFINEKHVIGEVKEKEEAHREYKKAIAEGHGAYLMDEERPNIFTVSVGNIPPWARVVIKITYIVELETVNEPDSCVLFTLPGSIASWSENSVLLDSAVTQSATKSVKVNSASKKSSLMLSIDMPFDILDVSSETHKIVVKKTATKACVKLQKLEGLSRQSLRLLIKVEEIHVPRIWIEEEKWMTNDQVVMVTFFPEFDYEATEDFDCTVLLDASNSMAGPLSGYAKYIASLLISKLPEECKLNVAAFGSNYEENFIGFETATTNAKTSAKKFVMSCRAEQGGSDLLYFLNSVQLMLGDNPNQRMQNIFLVSDGHLSEQARVLTIANQICKKSRSQTRFFTMAVGESPDSHLLQSLSVLTGGHYEHFLPSTRRTWKSQVQKQVSFARQPALTDVRFEWSNYESAPPGDKKDFLHVPEKVKCVFSGSRLTAYSFLPRCTKVTLNAKICGNEFSTVVTANALSKITGSTLHKLAAKAIFKEYESGRLADDSYVDRALRDIRKSSIISLSTRYSVVSKFTSFVAIEKRKENEDMSVTSGPLVSELVQAVFTDIIPGVSWGFEGKSVDENIDELLKRSSQMQASSIVRARELALEAKSLYETLDEPDTTQKLLLSATLCKLDIVPDGFDPYQELNHALHDEDGPGHDRLNGICRCSDSSVYEALQVLSNKFWPDYCSVQLASFPERFRPVAIWAFVACCRATEHSRKSLDFFSSNKKLLSTFWKEMHGISFKKGDEVTGEVMNRVKKALSSITAEMLDSFQPQRRSIVSEYHPKFMSVIPRGLAPSLMRKRVSAVRLDQGSNKDVRIYRKLRSHLRCRLPRCSGGAAAAAGRDAVYDDCEHVESIHVNSIHQRKLEALDTRKTAATDTMFAQSFEDDCYSEHDPTTLGIELHSPPKPASVVLEAMSLKRTGSNGNIPFSGGIASALSSLVHAPSRMSRAPNEKAELSRDSVDAAVDLLDMAFISDVDAASFPRVGAADVQYKTAAHSEEFGPLMKPSFFSSAEPETAESHLAVGRNTLAHTSEPSLMRRHRSTSRYALASAAAPKPDGALAQSQVISGGFGFGSTLTDASAASLNTALFSDDGTIPSASLNTALFSDDGTVPSFGSQANFRSSTASDSVCPYPLEKRPSEHLCKSQTAGFSFASRKSASQRKKSAIRGGCGFGSGPTSPTAATKPHTLGLSADLSSPAFLAVQESFPPLPPPELLPPLPPPELLSPLPPPPTWTRTYNQIPSLIYDQPYSQSASAHSVVLRQPKQSGQVQALRNAYLSPERFSPHSPTSAEAPVPQLRRSAIKSRRPSEFEEFKSSEKTCKERSVLATGIVAAQLCEEDDVMGFQDELLCIADRRVSRSLSASSSADLSWWCDKEEETTSSDEESQIAEGDDARTFVARLMSLLAIDNKEALCDILKRMYAGRGCCQYPNDDQMIAGRFLEPEKQLLSTCKEILVASGGRSLGTACFTAALDMLLTSIMAEVVKHACLLEKFHTLVEMLSRLTSLTEKWLKEADSIHPLLYSRLELGLSWEAAANAVIARIVTKLEDN